MNEIENEYKLTAERIDDVHNSMTNNYHAESELEFRSSGVDGPLIKGKVNPNSASIKYIRTFKLNGNSIKKKIKKKEKLEKEYNIEIGCISNNGLTQVKIEQDYKYGKEQFKQVCSKVIDIFYKDSIFR